jgi:hypothetical protein
MANQKVNKEIRQVDERGFKIKAASFSLGRSKELNQHIINKEGGHNSSKGVSKRQKSRVKSFFNGRIVHMSLHDITYKLLSSQHTRRVNDVIMPFFLTTPRSHGPSQERRRSHIISAWYLTKKLPGPRPGYPRTHLGALDHN